MAKYLVKASYNAEGLRGVMSKGGSDRVAAVTKSIKALGGKVESFYFAFGDVDAYVIVDLPDNTAAAAVGMAVSSSGLVSTETVVLLTAAEIDSAAKTVVAYRKPGE